MRPNSIIWFERLFLASILIGAVNSVLILNAIAAEPAGQPLSPAVLIWSIVIGNVVNLALWFLIARRGSGVGRWILTALFVLGAASLAFSVLTDSYPGGLEGALGALGWALQAAAMICLFTPQSSAWFKGHAGTELNGTFE